MSALVEDDFTRACAFFALAFVMMTIGGLLIGDLRLGVEWGLRLGAAFGAFAYFFVQPTGDDEPDGSESDDGVRPPSADGEPDAVATKAVDDE